MFVSHQWNGFQHPDPNGVQSDCIVKVFRRLRDGTIDRVEMDPFHTILYKTNHVIHKSELMELFSNAYLWYDFWSQPQPSMATDESQVPTLQQDLSNALASMSAYVERADCLVILVRVFELGFNHFILSFFNYVRRISLTLYHKKKSLGKINARIHHSIMTKTGTFRK